MRLLVVSCFFSFWHFVNAQQEFVRSFVDVFASDEFKGRGYVDNGCEKAAKYLAEQYVRFGLTPLSNSYFQPFSIPVNTFPLATTVAFGNTPLKEGVDYLIDPSSGSSSGKFVPFVVMFSSLSTLNTAKHGRPILVLELRKYS